MFTVIFDFDSTLIACESLEMILDRKLREAPEIGASIRRITEQGLRGALPFADSLRMRLALASPSQNEVEEFGKEAVRWITPGMESLVRELQHMGAQVWIVSGGVWESLLPVAEKLHIPQENVLGVKLLWNEDRSFAGIDPHDPFSRSKWEGGERYRHLWHKPVIAVGDAMSDYLLYEKGLVDRFILFTRHFRCDELLQKGVLQAESAAEVKTLITQWVR